MFSVYSFSPQNVLSNYVLILKIIYYRGQGVYRVNNHADMYRLWRHLHETVDGSPYWLHAFRTSKTGWITLDDYDGKKSYLSFF